MRDALPGELRAVDVGRTVGLDDLDGHGHHGGNGNGNPLGGNGGGQT